MKPRVLLTLAMVLAGSTPALAQTPRLNLPDPSPHATVSQRVGLTDITIDYHRPAVKQRKIWGGLVPYDEVWRAGANENTTISFSSPVTIGGKQLAAGTYGLHMIPTASKWTIALSNVSTAWGSFTYDEKEDVVRLTATPTPAEMEESLEYRFENPTETSANVVLHWEKLQVSFPITVDTKAVTLASLKGQLRGLTRFSWQGWHNASQWALKNDELDQALAWADKSISLQATYPNLTNKAAILEKKKDTKGAADLRAQAMKIATEADINNLGYQRMAEKKTDEALALFRKNVKEHPQSWNAYDSLGEALSDTGDKKGAAENYSKALSLAKDPADQKRITAILANLKK
jgi:tetratricopeptide (TPR) repeat protein